MSRARLPLCLSALALAVVACADPSPDPAPATGAPDPVPEALRIAEEYVEGYYDDIPELAYEAGYSDVDHARLSDRSPAARAAWDAREDAWLAALQGIDPRDLEGTEAAVPAAYARDRLESSVAMRSCRMSLWNVSPTWTGWQHTVRSALGAQPVGTAEERAAVLARLRDLPRYLDTELENLREGLRLGWSAPRSNVDEVVRQLDQLASSPPEESPFFDPAERAGDAEFSAAVAVVLAEEVLPAIATFRDALRDEYRPEARQEVGVSANPDGRACYDASVRFYVGLSLEAEAIHALGRRQMERIEEEMRAIAREALDTDDLPAVLERLRSDDAYTFSSEAEILESIEGAIDRARAVVPEWFGFVPTSEVVVRPYPASMELTGGGFYSSPAADGSRPGIFEIGTFAPETLSRISGLEATVFHETYPGHHLQGATVIERGGLHPVQQFFFNSGTGEGWALYAERLADEMGLYTSELDRLGQLSNEAFRAGRMVVDPGMHVLGWSRSDAIDYLLAHTAVSREEIESDVDRYVGVPGQATSYLVGSLEIQSLRTAAEGALGDRFDVRAFHDLVLEDGTITLSMLRAKVERWLGERVDSPEG